MVKDKSPIPTWVYRKNDVGMEKKLFADVGDIPKGEGWKDSPAPSAKKPAKAQKAAR